MPIVVTIKLCPITHPVSGDIGYVKEVTVTGEVTDKIEDIPQIYKAIIKELEVK